MIKSRESAFLRRAMSRSSSRGYQKHPLVLRAGVRMPRSRVEDVLIAGSIFGALFPHGQGSPHIMCRWMTFRRYSIVRKGSAICHPL